MKHVLQEDRAGCGIAAAAMISGVAYEHVRNWWAGPFHRGDLARLQRIGDGLRPHELGDLLDTLGHPAPIVCAPAVLIVRPKLQLWHYVVVTEEGEILDPAKDHIRPSR